MQSTSKQKGGHRPLPTNSKWRATPELSKMPEFTEQLYRAIQTTAAKLALDALLAVVHNVESNKSKQG
jgi:hypothetical protein